MRQYAAFRAVLSLLIGAALAGQAIAQEKSAVKQGFTLPARGNVRILLFRPWIKVGAIDGRHARTEC